MLADTPFTRFAVRVVVELFSSVGPASLLYTLWSLHYGWAIWSPPSISRTWVAAEACFYCFMLWYRTYLQRAAIHPTARTPEERHALLRRVRREIHDTNKFLSGWFKGAKVEDIGREEMKAFLNWAFWDGRATDADNIELEAFTYEVEMLCGVKFMEGPGKAKSLRLTLDPIEMDTRSLFYYSLIMIADMVTTIALYSFGFVHYRHSLTQNMAFPPRPLNMATSAQSPAKNIGYWYRPHTSKTRQPVVYVHGIGVGLITQLTFLRELDHALNEQRGSTDDGEVGILALEILPVSSRLTAPILHREEYLSQVKTILNHHGFDRFVLASHSYGSVIATHMLYDEELAAKISSTLFIDPVTINLHMPDVAYNFTARPPVRANEWELWYFASKDPGVAHTLGRHFFWSENVLWRDHIEELVRKGMNITVGLAEEDLIVDTLSVGRYLKSDEVGNPRLVRTDSNVEMRQEFPGQQADAWQRQKWSGKGLDIMWWPGLDHAQVFDEAHTRVHLINVLRDYCMQRPL